MLEMISQVTAFVISRMVGSILAASTVLYLSNIKLYIKPDLYTRASRFPLKL